MKKFTDSELWEEDWFLELPLKYLLLYIYIKDTCDFAGIWRTNKKKIEDKCGDKIDIDEALRLFNEEKIRFITIDKSKWLMTGYFVFQYGKTMNLSNRVHRSVFELYTSLDISLDMIEGLIEVIEGSKRPQIDPNLRDKDKDKDKDKENNIFFRRAEFSKHIQEEFSDKYDAVMLEEFIEYWTEANPNGRKMRFEMQKIFDIGRRLSTWKRNQKKFSGEEFVKGSGRELSYEEVCDLTAKGAKWEDFKKEKDSKMWRRIK